MMPVMPNFLKKATEWIGKIIGALFVVGIIIIGIKSEIIVPWQPSTTPVSYSVSGQDGRSIQIILKPDNQAIIWYDDPKNDYMEGNLVRWKGYIGTHYFWRIWNVSDNDTTFGPSLFGIRMYPDGVTPVVLDTEVVAHFVSGSQTPTLPNKGDRVRQQTVLFHENAIRFQDMWLEKDHVEPAEMKDDIETMLDLLSVGKS